MLKLDLYISKEAPSARNAAWLKPVSGGFALYALFNGKWQSLKLVDDNGTVKPGDDTPIDTLAFEQAGAAEAVQEAITGTATDTSSDMTLYGLKAYVDEQIEALG